jgi:hypothetical protein
MSPRDRVGIYIRHDAVKKRLGFSLFNLGEVAIIPKKALAQARTGLRAGARVGDAC